MVCGAGLTTSGTTSYPGGNYNIVGHDNDRVRSNGLTISFGRNGTYNMTRA